MFNQYRYEGNIGARDDPGVKKINSGSKRNLILEARNLILEARQDPGVKKINS